jgi:hypothetical protein
VLSVDLNDKNYKKNNKDTHSNKESGESIFQEIQLIKINFFF